MLDNWIPRARLIAVAQENGCGERTLEHWRYQGLLPRPRRDAQGSWRYPPAAEAQLRRLLHWRGRARTLDAVRIVLWVEGYAIELEDVRVALKALVTKTATAIRQEFHSSDGLAATIDTLARRLARMRGRAPFPHVVQMKLDERERAYGFLIALVASDADELDRRRPDAAAVERMLGLRTGRDGGLAHLSPVESLVAMAREQLSAERLHALIDTRATEDYEFVRLLARTLMLWMPLLVPTMGALIGSKAVALVDAAAELGPDVPAEVGAGLVLSMLVSLEVKGRSSERITRLLAELELGAVDSELLSLVTPARARAELVRLPQHYQAHLVAELARSRGSS
jgi:DNA-binding transcriptional MerR regulator